MSRVTKKMLEEEIEQLRKINDYNMSVITELNTQINNIEVEKEIVSKQEFQVLLEKFNNQKKLTEGYKQMLDDLKKNHKKERNVLIDKINTLQEQVDNKELKLNVRGAGRKAYSNKNVIEKIYNLYLDNNSLQDVANELNRLEIKTARGKAWSKSSIRFILLNHKNVLNELIDEDTFYRTQRLLHDNKKTK